VPNLFRVLFMVKIAGGR